MTLTTIIFAAYLIGSIPFALLLARRLGVDDLRRVGSGNVGAANVLRAFGVRPGVLVALLDMSKGVVSVAIAQKVGHSGAATAVAGLAAVVGHIYPVWLRFRGGKGVATACGVFSMLAPFAAAPALAIFITTVWITGYVSVGSVVAVASLPPLAWVLGASTATVIAALAAAALILFRHRSNLMRVRTGTERRLGARL